MEDTKKTELGDSKRTTTKSPANAFRRDRRISIFRFGAEVDDDPRLTHLLEREQWMLTVRAGRDSSQSSSRTRSDDRELGAGHARELGTGHARELGMGYDRKLGMGHRIVVTSAQYSCAF
jgi:hypothetical protein